MESNKSFWESNKSFWLIGGGVLIIVVAFWLATPFVGFYPEMENRSQVGELYGTSTPSLPASRSPGSSSQYFCSDRNFSCSVRSWSTLARSLREPTRSGRGFSLRHAAARCY